MLGALRAAIQAVAEQAGPVVGERIRTDPALAGALRERAGRAFDFHPALSPDQPVRFREEIHQMLRFGGFVTVLRAILDGGAAGGAADGATGGTVGAFAADLLPLSARRRLAAAVAGTGPSEGNLVGALYEAIIEPEFRHGLGQFYTPDGVVDLLTAFAVRSQDDIVLDPASGGGGFLWSAYQRKRALGASHATALAGTWAAEVTPFAAELSTVTLATAGPGTPNVLPVDFFDLSPGGAPGIPARLDAILGNPPYISYRRLANRGAIRAALDPAAADLPRFSGKSDAYAWFIVHATRFLGPGGRLAFVVSSALLFADYAVPLIRFIGRHYRIVAVVDSTVERWFPGADTNAVLLLLERTDDARRRDRNEIRFVRLRSPLCQLLPAVADSTRPAGVEALLRAVTGQPTAPDDPRITVRSVPQGEHGAVANGRRWGQLLRQTDAVDRILRRARERGLLAPLGELADLTGGLVTRANAYFLVREIAPPHGVGGVAGAGVVAVVDGTGAALTIERCYLRPAIKGPEALLTPTRVRDSDLRLVHITAGRDELRRDRAVHALRYIERGETVAYRLSPDSLKGGVPALRSNIRNRRPHWYSLRVPDGADERLLVPEHADRRYPAVLLDGSLAGHVVIDKLFVVTPRAAGTAHVLLASLNSLLTWLQLELCGRTQLGQGVLELKKADWSGVLVLNPDRLTDAGRAGLLTSFAPVAGEFGRDAAGACGEPLRQAFDRIVFRLCGADDPEAARVRFERELRSAVSERRNRRRGLG